jgi:hypothetical protein
VITAQRKSRVSPAPTNRDVSVANQQTKWFLAVWAMMFLLANYQGAGSVLILFPIVLLRRRALIPLLCLCGIFAFKFAASKFLPVPFGYESYQVSSIAALKEMFSVALSLECFLLGYFVLNKRFFEKIDQRLLLGLCIINVVTHDIIYKSLFWATFDSPQIISLFSLFVVTQVRRSSFMAKAVAAVLVFEMNARLGNSFTAIAGIVILLAVAVKSLRLNVRLPWRAAVTALIIFFSVASLFAYLVSVRTEGNNGTTRAYLASVAWSVIKDAAPFGTPIGLPIVPVYGIDNLGWTQYFSATGEEFNIYGLSFHNSILYLMSRYGILALPIFVWFLRFVPKRGPLTLLMMTAVVFLGLSANVAIESVRAGPGAALVLGSLFGWRIVRLPKFLPRKRRERISRPYPRSPHRRAVLRDPANV